jgi:L-fuculose-phosphate aldolase
MDLAMACAGALKKANVILMESHGATTVGKNLDEAFFRMETLEKVATIYRDSLTFASAYRLTRQLDCLHDITSLFK